MSKKTDKSLIWMLILIPAVFLYAICPAMAAQSVKAPAKITDIEAGSGYCVALRSDGTVWCWGDNENGAIADGTLGDRNGDTADNIHTKPSLVMGNVKSISGTYSNCYAVTTDNSLWVWGFNFGGRVGNGGTYDCSEPVKVLSDVRVAASGNSNHSAAIKNDGTLWTWGLNLDGQLLNGSKNHQLIPLNIMKDIQSVAVGEGHTMVIKKNGDLYVWGRNWKGQLGDGTGRARLKPFKLKSNVKKIYAGSNQSYFITKDGTLWGCGKDFTGKYSAPVRLMTNVTDVNASPSCYVAVKSDGTLWGCGENEYGAFGDGTRTYKNKPVKIMNDVSKAAAGEDYLLVLKKNGTLWSSGRNNRGQLGTGDRKDRTRFVQITGFPAAGTATATGKLSNSMSLDGNLTCWKGMEPIGTDPAGDVAAGRFDITGIYAAKDERYLYIAVKASGSHPDIDVNIDTNCDGEEDCTALCYVDQLVAFLDDSSHEEHIGCVPLSYKKAIEFKIPLALIHASGDMQISANYRKDADGDKSKDTMSNWFMVP